VVLPHRSLVRAELSRAVGRCGDTHGLLGGAMVVERMEVLRRG
jgi:hypothetical protein